MTIDSRDPPFILWCFFTPPWAHCRRDMTPLMRVVLWWWERWAVARCEWQQCDTEGGPWVNSTHWWIMVGRSTECFLIRESAKKRSRVLRRHSLFRSPFLEAEAFFETKFSLESKLHAWVLRTSLLLRGSSKKHFWYIWLLRRWHPRTSAPHTCFIGIGEIGLAHSRTYSEKTLRELGAQLWLAAYPNKRPGMAVVYLWAWPCNARTSLTSKIYNVVPLSLFGPVEAFKSCGFAGAPFDGSNMFKHFFSDYTDQTRRVDVC